MNLAIVPAHNSFSLHCPLLFIYSFTMNHCLVTIATLGEKKMKPIELRPISEEN